MCCNAVNEALGDDGKGFKKAAPWYPAVPNYVDVAFLAADKARKAANAPGVKLFCTCQRISVSAYARTVSPHK